MKNLSLLNLFVRFIITGAVLGAILGLLSLVFYFLFYIGIYGVLGYMLIGAVLGSINALFIGLFQKVFPRTDNVSRQFVHTLARGSITFLVGVIMFSLLYLTSSTSVVGSVILGIPPALFALIASLFARDLLTISK